MSQRVFIMENETLAGFEFSATMDETHSGDADIVTHPIEGDAYGNIRDVTDHIRPRSETVQLNAVISNTPIIALASLRAPRILDSNDFRENGEAAYRQLKTWKNRGTLLSLFTTLEVYESMVIKSISVVRDVDRSDSVFVSLTLQEIFISVTETTAAPELGEGKGGRGGKRNLGKKGKGTPPAAAGTKSSLLFKIFSFF